MRLLRFIILTLLMVLVEYGLSYYLSNKFDLRLIDSMFYVGVFSTVISLFFSSSGGIITNYSETEVATSYEGLKSNHTFKRTFGSLNVNFINTGSVLFLIIVLIVSLL